MWDLLEKVPVQKVSKRLYFDRKKLLQRNNSVLMDAWTIHRLDSILYTVLSTVFFTVQYCTPDFPSHADCDHRLKTVDVWHSKFQSVHVGILCDN